MLVSLEKQETLSLTNITHHLHISFISTSSIEYGQYKEYET